MSEVIFVSVAEMGQDGGGGVAPRTKAYDAPQTIGFILSDLGVELGDRKVKLNGNEATVETMVRRDNAHIVIVPRKIKGGD